MIAYEEVRIEDGKYTIRSYENGMVVIYRYDEEWIQDPVYAKMFIALVAEHPNKKGGRR